MDIGKRLHEIRTAKGLSQGDMEKRSGLFRCYISRVENRHTVPSIETLERLAKALGVETYQLFLEGDKEPEALPFTTRAAPDTREFKLIEAFGKLKQRHQGLVLGLIRKMAKAA
jgi:transcriptional regulator with XRE-family HTH domain